MLLLLFGLVLFFAVHLVPSQIELREALVQRFGGNVYRLIFSVLSLAGLVLIVIGYGKLQVMPGKNTVLWSPPVWTRHAAFLLMLPAMILLVAAYVPSRLRGWVEHPMLVAVMIWAVAHLLANADLASLMLFASFLAFAVFDRISVGRRGAAGPLGKRQPASIMNDVAVVAVGIGLYAGMLVWGHRYLIGIPLV